MDEGRDFFQALPRLSNDLFINLIQTAIEPVEGELRPLSEFIGQKGRKELPSRDEILGALGSRGQLWEKQLQYLLWHRGCLLTHQRIIAFEVPCSLREFGRRIVADFLVIDDKRQVPIIVEVKRGTATDSLTGVLLELLVQWCFHKSAMSPFRRQLQNFGEAIPDSVTQPEALIVAPARFYQETLRRSKDKRRHGEVDHAFRLLGVLEAVFGLSVSFIEVNDDWASQGTELRCRQFSASDMALPLGM